MKELGQASRMQMQFQPAPLSSQSSSTVAVDMHKSFDFSSGKSHFK
jgi:hypothetical protein